MSGYEYPGNAGYRLRPVNEIKWDGEAPRVGNPAMRTIVEELFESSDAVAVEVYPGIDERLCLEVFSTPVADTILFPRDWRLSDSEMEDEFSESLSDDRVFGYMTGKTLARAFRKERLDEARSLFRGKTLVVGTGASVVAPSCPVIHVSKTRWNIQLGWRAGRPNWMTDNPRAPQLEKYKRGFFIEWRLGDRLKDEVRGRIRWFADANDESCFKAICAEAHAEALRQVSRRPFRMEPYFDPGVWGGQWMKKVCGLPENGGNYAWCFDGVPEENSVNFGFGGTALSFPMMDMVMWEPEALMGKGNVARFGREFPIRFDLLDTMDGQNLSLQVHPTTDYIQRAFGMHYTQDESYYILDAMPGACVYIGLKEGVDPAEMEAALREAQSGGRPFEAEKFVNKVPVEKHDHVLIPAGTVHCSGAGCMVLEISATPYIFTFKLWDWGRVGLDGLPRPIHIDHGMKNIQFSRTTPWVMDNLVHREETLLEDDGHKIERTGLHELEFIETLRYTTSTSFTREMTGGVDQCNLVDGRRAVIESPSGAFEPFEVFHAESFIVPASCGLYRVRALQGEVKLVVASVRGSAAGRL